MPLKSSNDGKGRKRLEQHREALRGLTGRRVEAGWFESARYKGGKGVPPKSVGLSIAQVARYNEHGTVKLIEGEDGETTKKVVIPARPFMRLAHVRFNQKRNEIQTKIGKKVINGQITPEKALGQIGLAMEGEIVDSIKNGNWTPNAESTKARKESDVPLIDTAQMWKAVTSKVS